MDDKTSNDIWYIRYANKRPFKIRVELNINNENEVVWVGNFIDNGEEARFKPHELFKDPQFTRDNF